LGRLGKQLHTVVGNQSCLVTLMNLGLVWGDRGGGREERDHLVLSSKHTHTYTYTYTHINHTHTYTHTHTHTHT